MSEISIKTDINDLITDLSTEDRLLQLDALLIQGEQVECPLDMQFSPGMWIRERFVPMGTFFSTHTWKVSHPFYCSMGDLLIWTKEKGWVMHSAVCRGLTPAGTKRVVYALTDVCWTTFHSAPFVTGEENDWPDDKKAELIERLEDMWLEKYSNRFLPLPELKQ